MLSMIEIMNRRIAGEGLRGEYGMCVAERVILDMMPENKFE